MRRARVRRMTRVSLSHSQRDLLTQEVAVMHQVSYQHFAEMKLKTGIIRASNSIFSFPFLFQEKNVWLPLCSMSFSLEIFHSPPKSQQGKRVPPVLKIIIPQNHPLQVNYECSLTIRHFVLFPIRAGSRTRPIQFSPSFSQQIHPENSFLRAPLQICLLLIVAMVKTIIICCRSQSLAFTTEIKWALPFRFCFPKHIFHDQLSRLEFLEAWLALTIGLEVSKPRPMVVNAGQR